MTVDPRYGFYLSIALAIIGALGVSTTQLTDLFGPDAAKRIIAGVALLLAAGNGVNAILHAIPSKPGAANEFPLGPTPPKP